MLLSIFAMANYSRSLIELCECFRGAVPKHADWMSLIGLANQTLTTPALMEFATRCKDKVPEDVYLYIREMFDRNMARNDRLAMQLAEIVAAINDRGVTPILLKGAATLAIAARPQRGLKLMSDLDIMVLPDQIEETMNALHAIGYRVHIESEQGAGKWYVDLKRSGDVGMVDLHRELPGPALLYRQAGSVQEHCKAVQIGRGTAYIPSATYQALILTIHDQFQDYDYWTGSIDVRHLIDLRNLATSSEGIDWERLASLTPSKLARNALETQLVALFSLLGVDVPTPMRTRFIPCVQHWRRVAQARLPLLRQALLALAVLDYRNYREFHASDRGETASRKWALPKSDSLVFLSELTRRHRAGKV
jgi:hypothetical protein